MIGIPTRACRHDAKVPAEVREMFWRIFAVDTYAATWRAGEPYTFCVMSKQLYERAVATHPDMHRVIDDVELRREATRIIKKYAWPLVCDEGPDAVLVLAPAY